MRYKKAKSSGDYHESEEYEGTPEEIASLWKRQQEETSEAEKENVTESKSKSCGAHSDKVTRQG